MVSDTNPQPSNLRTRRSLISIAHDPPQEVDEQIPTYETWVANAIGHPGGGPYARSQGSWPWVVGSCTIGSNKVLNINCVDLLSSSPNVYFLLRHSHSGTNAIPGGTIAQWYFPAAGQKTIISDHLEPYRSIRQGTLTLYGVGARKGATGSVPFKMLPSTGSHSFGGVIKGWIE